MRRVAEEVTVYTVLQGISEMCTLVREKKHRKSNLMFLSLSHFQSSQTYIWTPKQSSM